MLAGVLNLGAIVGGAQAAASVATGGSGAHGRLQAYDIGSMICMPRQAHLPRSRVGRARHLLAGSFCVVFASIFFRLGELSSHENIVSHR
jgi:hypothetical protein